MFIQTEATPNPATLKFLPGKTVLESGTREFRGAPEADGVSPLAARLFAVDGIEGVFLGADFVSVTKAEDREWQGLRPVVLGAIMEHFMSGEPVLTNGAGGEFRGRGIRCGRCRDRGDNQGADRNPSSPRGGERWRRHHL